MAEESHNVFSWVRWVYDILAEPLRVNEDESFRLSSPETHTTTIDGDIGWKSRPPAVLDCPRCESEILQSDSRDEIDCPRCVASYGSKEFEKLDLLRMICPVCGDKMEHGRRHPESIDVPEWATCHSCRYHWEFKHSY